MGLAFTIVERQDAGVLDWWMTEFMSISVENP